MKIAIVTDSNSGITQRQAEQEGIFVVPMPFMINGQTYYEDIDLTQEQFYEKLAEGADISTSQPTPESVTGLWDRLLEEYDQIVHIPMSSGLSGSCQTAMMLAQDYEGKVFVVNNHRISVTQRQSALDAKRLAEEGKTGEEIASLLYETRYDSSIYITVDTLKYLKKGGRVTPAAAALGTLLRIKPVLTIQGEKLDAFAKARTMKQAKTIMLSALKKDLEERFSDGEARHSFLQIAHTANFDAAEELKQELAELYPGAPIHADPLSLSVACHIGPGALAVACTKMLEG
ncbi:dihydroxyacetone kinase [Lachnoclostridium sp. An14]|uniref:DegV family protein n=1 Tax=Lachnoclostridium sp. An14 TaxID=1965562 RepID=UPI000B39EC41|nr:DegV family protein [Lachnoclostridium sp. An14]OUQ20594.1 dihydroxyacetone kinase [Lachnoclostridium sp. An14]